MFIGIYGAPGEIRTPGLLVRSQTLYPAELRAHFCLTNSSMRYLKREATASFSAPQQCGELGKETSRGFWCGSGGCVCRIFYFFHCSRRLCGTKPGSAICCPPPTENPTSTPRSRIATTIRGLNQQHFAVASTVNAGAPRRDARRGLLVYYRGVVYELSHLNLVALGLDGTAFRTLSMSPLVCTSIKISRPVRWGSTLSTFGIFISSSACRLRTLSAASSAGGYEAAPTKSNTCVRVFPWSDSDRLSTRAGLRIVTLR